MAGFDRLRVSIHPSSPYTYHPQNAPDGFNVEFLTLAMHMYVRKLCCTVHVRLRQHRLSTNGRRPRFASATTNSHVSIGIPSR